MSLVIQVIIISGHNALASRILMSLFGFWFCDHWERLRYLNIASFMTTATVPSVSQTPKFSVLGKTDAVAATCTSRRSAMPPPRTTPAMTTDITNSDLATEASSTWCLLPQALYHDSVELLHAPMRQVPRTVPQEQPVAPRQCAKFDTIPVVSPAEHLVRCWQWVDQGQLRSLPLEQLSEPASVFLERLEKLGLQTSTLHLARALYGITKVDGTTGVGNHGQDSDQPHQSLSSIPYLGDVLLLSESAAVEEAAVITESPVMAPGQSEVLVRKKFPASGSVPTVAATTTSTDDDNSSLESSEDAVNVLSGDSHQQQRLLATDKKDTSNSAGSSLVAQWQAVDAGKLRSLPMGGVSAEQLATLREYLPDFSTTTLRCIQALYGGVVDIADQKTNGGSVMAANPMVSIVSSKGTHDDTQHQQALLSHNIASEPGTPRESTTLPVVKCQDGNVASTPNGTTQSFPTNLTQTSDTEDCVNNEPSNTDVESQIGLVEATDLPAKNGALDKAKEQATGKTVPLDTAASGEPSNNDQNSVAITAPTSNTQQVEGEHICATVFSGKEVKGELAPSPVPVESSLLEACLETGPILPCTDPKGEVLEIPAVTASDIPEPQLSRAITPILSNRSVDKETDEVKVRSLNQLLEESATPDRSPENQPISPKPIRPSPPSYSEMAKKMASPPKLANSPSSKSPQVKLPASVSLEAAPALKAKTGKRFVASLSAVVSEGGSRKVALPPAKSLDTIDSPIVVLVTSQATHPEVVRQQNLVTDTLSAQEISYISVDAAQRENKSIRNSLFEISGSHGEYPQIFVQDSLGKKVFWGSYDRFVHDDGLGVDRSLILAKKEPVKQQPSQAPSKPKKRSVKFSVNGAKPKSAMPSSSGRPPLPAAKAHAVKSAKQTDITFYGATSFVAKHALDYMLQVSISLPGVRKITLAGRSEKKIAALQARLKEKMANLAIVHPKATGKCVFNTVIAESSDKQALIRMCQSTKVVANFAGPFERYSENVVASCAEVGTDYVDITGEVTWASKMRAKYGSLAEKSGARIISFCGFDSVPSDLAIFGAVDALKKKAGGESIAIAKGTCWHFCVGMANGGTVQTAAEMPLNLGRCLFRWIPFLLEDPLALTHPRVRVDPKKETLKNRMALTEWINQMPSMDSIFGLGFSAPFFMAPLNAKIVHASSVALNYGPMFTYRERFCPVGIKYTRDLGILSFIPALFIQLAVMMASAMLKFPILGQLIARTFFPAGSGMSDQACQKGLCDVYAEVETAPNNAGKVDRANCVMKFEGDPGNWTTAQCICESALSLVLDRQKLPPRSIDGFGTPAELLGTVLLKRLRQTSVRPVEIETYIRQSADPGVNFLLHY